MAEKRTWTPNQVVAYNLARAREHRGWTQKEAAERLQAHLGGKPWSVTAWSAAERSVGGERVRQFDADELIAFARTFDLPITFFLLPPPDGEADVYSAGGEKSATAGELTEAVVGYKDELGARVFEVLDSLPPSARTRLQNSYLTYSMITAGTAMLKRLKPLERYARTLSQVADALDKAQEDAKETMFADLIAGTLDEKAAKDDDLLRDLASRAPVQRASAKRTSGKGAGRG